MINFEKWIWIELIGFDNCQTDFGVKAYLDNTGFIPKGISLLLWEPDFIHSHSDLSKDGLLPEFQCAYGARPQNVERERQAWTKYQLRGLISELKSHGVEVYFSVFDQIMREYRREELNLPRRQRWIDNHPEILYVLKDGRKSLNVCPWKRLNDGSFYEDFFIDKLCRVIRDYGFHGFHGADGYAHPRYPIYAGDFSDDMINQFSESKGIDVAGKNTEAKASVILGDHRIEWMNFITGRHNQFWRKTVTALKMINAGLIFNTAWTRDPFEAKYRYGVDYRELTEIGVNTFIVEAPAAVVELEGWNKTEINTVDKFTSMIMRIKTAVPKAKLILLNCIKDDLEKYNVLADAPEMLKSNVMKMANVFCRSNIPERCISGIMACLGDGISRPGWSWIDKAWDDAFSLAPENSKVTIIWSDKFFKNELDNYFTIKHCTSFQILAKLFSLQVPVTEIARINNLGSLSDIILVIHPGLFPEDEIRKVLDYRNGPVILAGIDHNFKYICEVYKNGMREYRKGNFSCIPVQEEPEPASWLNELPATLPEESFFSEISQLTGKMTRAVRVHRVKSEKNG